jgi:NifU-like protein
MPGGYPDVAELGVPFYPAKIHARLRPPQDAGAPSAEGVGLALECGSVAKVAVDVRGDIIESAGFRSNGCGFAVAAADAMAEWLSGKRLADLHGLSARELDAMLNAEVGVYPPGRRHCRAAAIEAARAALSALRSMRVKEFVGESALICSCFGVSEHAIVALARESGVSEVEEVGELLRAGTGCGSCRMLIREILDHVDRDLGDPGPRSADML